MQKLEERNTYTPTDIPHVSGKCDRILNKEETLSVSGLKTFSNTSDAALTAIRVCRTGLVSLCQCYSALIESGTRQPIRYSATNYIKAGYAPPTTLSRGFPLPLHPTEGNEIPSFHIMDKKDLEKELSRIETEFGMTPETFHKACREGKVHGHEAMKLNYYYEFYKDEYE